MKETFFVLRMPAVFLDQWVGELFLIFYTTILVFVDDSDQDPNLKLEWGGQKSRLWLPVIQQQCSELDRIRLFLLLEMNSSPTTCSPPPPSRNRGLQPPHTCSTHTHVTYLPCRSQNY